MTKIDCWTTVFIGATHRVHRPLGGVRNHLHLNLQSSSLAFQDNTLPVPGHSPPPLPYEASRGSHWSFYGAPLLVHSQAVKGILHKNLIHTIPVDMIRDDKGCLAAARPKLGIHWSGRQGRVAKPYDGLISFLFYPGPGVCDD